MLENAKTVLGEERLSHIQGIINRINQVQEKIRGQEINENMIAVLSNTLNTTIEMAQKSLLVKDIIGFPEVPLNII